MHFGCSKQLEDSKSKKLSDDKSVFLNYHFHLKRWKMKKVLFVIIVLSMLFPAVAKMDTTPDRFLELLTKAGLKPSDLTWNMWEIGDFQRDPFRFPWFDELHQRPLVVPYDAKLTLSRFEMINTVRDAVVMCARRSGNEVSRWDYGPKPEISKENPFYESLLNMYAEDNWKLPDSAKESLKAKCASLSPKWQAMLAEFVGYASQVRKYRNLAMRKIPCEKWDAVFTRCSMLLDSGSDFPIDTYDAGLEIDFRWLYYAAAQGALAVDKMVALLGEELPTSLEITTPLGAISISGSEVTTHNCISQLLLIDTQGDDNYSGFVGSNASIDNPFSVCIDVSGNDVYADDAGFKPQCGSGRFGFGVLVDMTGDDMYRSATISQGAGCFGVGVLKDMAGNDIYEGKFECQGAAEFGIGVLQDISGNDKYHSYFGSQGFGYTQGIGLLQDKAGDDVYDADDKDIVNPSAQSAQHNASFCQGAGFGARAELDNGHSMSGGVGVLQDIKGNDKYSCGVFGQGVAYWHALGILSDYEGNDSYLGTWYVQGAAAHFGIAYFQDRAGNDTYQATMATSIGVGHDTSLAYHIDLGGDDTYNAWRTENGQKVDAGLCVGAGNANGMGFFVNIGGNDKYDVGAGRTLGAYGDPAPCGNGFMREKMINIGVFIDIGGEDSYRVDFAVNNKTWQAQPFDCPDRNIDFGLGGDFADGTVKDLF